MFLTNEDMVELIGFRHELHRHPEISGEESETARRVVEVLAPMRPDRVLSGLGGHGVAAVFEGGAPGPTLLFRSELGALPIEELTDLLPFDGAGQRPPLRSRRSSRDTCRPRPGSRSKSPGDGPRRADVPAGRGERRGRGCGHRRSALCRDRAGPLPGLPFGHVALRPGIVNCASRGMRIALRGKTAHASTPHQGVSPMRAVAALMPALTDLGRGEPPDPDFSQ